MMRILPALVIIGYTAICCALGGMLHSGGSEPTDSPEAPRHMVVVAPPTSTPPAASPPLAPAMTANSCRSFAVSTATA